MQATRESVDRFLNTPRRLLESADIVEILEKAERMEANITKTTTVLTGMPSGGGMDRASKLAKYVDSKEEYAKVLAVIEAARQDSLRLIKEAVLTDRQRKLLTERYVKMYTLPRIAKHLEISLRHIYRERDAALDACAAYVTLNKPNYAKDALEY